MTEPSVWLRLLLSWLPILILYVLVGANWITTMRRQNRMVVLLTEIRDRLGSNS